MQYLVGVLLGPTLWVDFATTWGGYCDRWKSFPFSFPFTLSAPIPLPPCGSPFPLSPSWSVCFLATALLSAVCCCLSVWWCLLCLLPDPSVGFLVCLSSPPETVHHVIEDPVHAIVYIVFMLGSCAFFSKTWIDVSGSSAKDVCYLVQIYPHALTPCFVCKYRWQSSSKNRIWWWGAIVNLPWCMSSTDTFLQLLPLVGYVLVHFRSWLTSWVSGCFRLPETKGKHTQSVNQFLFSVSGAIGSGTGILLAVTIIYQYFEVFAKEQAEMGGLGSMFF